MDNAREMINWFDGFAKVAEEHGVTDPVLLQNLIKTSWFLEAQTKNPRAFYAAYNEAMAQKQAGFKWKLKHSPILQALDMVKKPAAKAAPAAAPAAEAAGTAAKEAPKGSGALGRFGRALRNTALIGGGLAVGAGGSSAVSGAGDVIHDAVAQERRRKILELMAQDASAPRATGTPYSGYRV